MSLEEVKGNPNKIDEEAILKQINESFCNIDGYTLIKTKILKKQVKKPRKQA